LTMHATELNLVTPKPIIQPIYEQNHLIVVVQDIPNRSYPKPKAPPLIKPYPSETNNDTSKIISPNLR
jgi:hypothetical protein